MTEKIAPKTSMALSRAPVILPRRLAGAISARKAAEVDRSIPTATPIRKRMTHSIHTWVMKAAAMALRMNTHRLKAKTRLRPMRSDRSPKTMRPTAVPTKETATSRPLSRALSAKVLDRKTIATLMTVRS